MKYTKDICVKCTIVVVLMMLAVPGWAVVKQEDSQVITKETLPLRYRGSGNPQEVLCREHPDALLMSDLTLIQTEPVMSNQFYRTCHVE